MAAGLTADAILLIHFAWIGFAIFGALAIFRWRWLIWVHPPVLAWSTLVMLAGWLCPLTPLELYFRELAGEQGFDGGFIEHYIASLIYPAGLTRGVQIGLGLALAGFNALVYAALFQYRRRKS
jgi:hypothetical protein